MKQIKYSEWLLQTKKITLKKIDSRGYTGRQEKKAIKGQGKYQR